MSTLRQLPHFHLLVIVCQNLPWHQQVMTLLAASTYDELYPAQPLTKVSFSPPGPWWYKKPIYKHLSTVLMSQKSTSWPLGIFKRLDDSKFSLVYLINYHDFYIYTLKGLTIIYIYFKSYQVILDCILKVTTLEACYLKDICGASTWASHLQSTSQSPATWCCILFMAAGEGSSPTWETRLKLLVLAGPALAVRVCLGCESADKRLLCVVICLPFKWHAGFSEFLKNSFITLSNDPSPFRVAPAVWVFQKVPHT